MDVSKLIKIKCRRIAEKNPGKTDFGRLCTHVLAYADKDGHIYIECSECGNLTQIMHRTIQTEENGV